MNYDIVLIGGGMMGLMSAWRLSQQHPDARIAVFERTTCGAGASHACLGALIPYPFSRQRGLPGIQRASVRRYPEICAVLKAQTGIDPQYTQGGRLYMLDTPGQLENARRDAAKSEGQQHILEPGTPDPVTALEPEAIPSGGGTLKCDATAWLDIPSFLAALKEACVQQGVHIHEHTDITTLAEAHAQADQVVVCAGSWTSQLLPEEMVTPVKGQGLRLKLPEQRFTRLIRQGKVYAIPHADGTVIVGSTTEPEAGFDVTPTAEGRAHILNQIYAFLPVLREAEVVGHWAGLRPKSGPNRPLARRIDARTLVAAGHYKIGLCLAPQVTDMVCAELTL